MIRTNLSTRPFYNERAVHFWLLVIAAVAVLATAFNVSRVLRYSRSDTELAARAARDESRAADLRQQAARLRATVDPKQVEFASSEARQANALIDRRTFSWTDLLNRLEKTQPGEVRLVAVRPRVDKDGTIVLAMNVVSKAVGDVDAVRRKGGRKREREAGRKRETDARRSVAAMTLWRRIVVERRILIIPLAFGIVVNLAIYALVVYPLGVKSASAAGRAEAATEALKAAEHDIDSARALVTGKIRAEHEISTFYDEVLPGDLTAARRLTYAALPALAQKSKVQYQQSRYDPEKVDKDERLGRLHIRMVLVGDYEGFRRFIYEFESSPEFVILDNFTMIQSDPAKPLVLTLEMSTYYRSGEHGN